MRKGEPLSLAALYDALVIPKLTGASTVLVDVHERLARRGTDKRGFIGCTTRCSDDMGETGTKVD